MNNYLTKAEEGQKRQELIQLFAIARDQLYKIGYKEIYENYYTIKIQSIGVHTLALCKFVGYDFSTGGKQFELIFNPNYLKYGKKEDFANTMMHELIHSLEGCMCHTGKWKQIACIVNNIYPQYHIKRTSNTNEKYKKNVLDKLYKYEIECKKCHSKWKYQKMTKTIQSCSQGTATCSCGSREFIVRELK